MVTNEEKVKQIIADLLQVDVGEVNLYSDLVEDLGADSLDVIELGMQLEEEFDLEIPDEDIERIKTVKDVLDYIKERA